MRFIHSEEETNSGFSSHKLDMDAGADNNRFSKLVSICTQLIMNMMDMQYVRCRQYVRIW